MSAAKASVDAIARALTMHVAARTRWAQGNRHACLAMAQRAWVALLHAPSLARWRQAALLGVLLLLILRGALTSATFMSPDGAILGWTRLATPRCIVCQARSVGGRQTTPATYAALLAREMTLDEQLGQLLIVQFAGQDATPDALQMVNGQAVGGVLSFAANIGSGEQTRAMTSQLQRAAPVPLLMAVDQEGGPVNRFQALVGPLPSTASLTSVAAAQARGAQDAGILAAYGYNFNLAPVVDVGEANPQLAGRTFGMDPQRVAAMAGAYLAGVQAQGQVTACLKHFPGLGATSTDPHLGLPVAHRSLADWRAIDLAPYRSLLAQHDVRAIMATHEIVPSVDGALPASLSPALIDGALRQQLGFQGVVITDSLLMGALNGRWSAPQAAVLAIKAGADMVIGAQSPQMVTQIESALKTAIGAGVLSRERIATSVQRILTMKITMGLIPLAQASGQKETTHPIAIPTATPQRKKAS